MPRTPAGLNPSALVLDSGGDLLFVANETSNSISVYSVSSSDGTLTRSCRIAIPHGSRPVALALSPSGKFLYVGSANLPVVFGYSVTSGRALWRRFRDRRLRSAADQFRGGGSL